MPIAAAVPYIIGAAGIGASLYGANKQSKDQAHQDDLNRGAVKESDLSGWKNYIMQRGLDPSAVTTFGQIPQGAAPVNTKLPLWANISTNQPGSPTGTSMIRRRA